ncbi:MAG: thioredoxin domain-containing protein [Candidatus Paceibacterota bacterium]
METENNVGGVKSNLGTPIAIVIAGIIIAGAMYFSDGSKTNNPVDTKPLVQASSLEKVREISAEDHIRGNPNAKIVIVEYSDTECPFCVRLHQTMKQVMDQYGKTGEVAWVYRHFPLDQLHPKARNEAAALECAGELGGNDKFWAYTDRIYEITPANNGLDVAELPKIAEHVGLDVVKFNSCLNSGKYSAKVQQDVQNAQDTGGNGTPWNIVVLKEKMSSSQEKSLTDYIKQNGLQENMSISGDKAKVSISGALPLVMFQKIIDILK